MQVTDERPLVPATREFRLLELLQRVWTYAITTKSDDARVYADEIAEGASRGLLTTLVVYGSEVYGRLWKPTPQGLLHLAANGQLIANQEVTKYGELCNG